MADSEAVPNPDFGQRESCAEEFGCCIEKCIATIGFFFVALTNGVAVLFTRGANLSCVWFSIIAVIIADMFFLGMVLPIWYGFRQLHRYKDKLQNCVVKRRSEARLY